jgi:hypothetical protein
VSRYALEPLDRKELLVSSWAYRTVDLFTSNSGDRYSSISTASSFNKYFCKFALEISVV